MSDNPIIFGWASAARALGCPPSRLRRLVADGPLEVPKDERGVCQFGPAEIQALRVALANGWTAPTATQAGAEVPRVAEPRPADVAPAVRPQPAPVRPPTAPSAPSSGVLAARAFRLLDEGVGPSGLVKALEITPAAAMDLFEAWKEATAADQDAEDLRAALDLLRRGGWTCADLVEAFRQVRDAEELYEDAGFTGEAALALLRAVRGRGWKFAEALEALDALPNLEEQERRTAAAVAVSIGAQHRVQEAQRALERLQRELRAFVPALGWLRLAQALAALVAEGSGPVAALRDALAARPPGSPPEELLGCVEPEADSEARLLLAAWAVSVLPRLVVPRAECEAAVRAARRERDLEDLAARLWLTRG